MLFLQFLSVVGVLGQPYCFSLESLIDQTAKSRVMGITFLSLHSVMYGECHVHLHHCKCKVFYLIAIMECYFIFIFRELLSCGDTEIIVSNSVKCNL